MAITSEINECFVTQSQSAESESESAECKRRKANDAQLHILRIGDQI